MVKNGTQPPIPIYVKPVEEADTEIFSSSLGITVGIVFLVIAFLLFILGNSQNQKLVTYLGIFSINFTSIVLEAVPFMLIVTLVGGAIEVFVPLARIDRFLGREKKYGVFLAGGLGLLFPTCECAICFLTRQMA